MYIYIYAVYKFIDIHIKYSMARFVQPAVTSGQIATSLTHGPVAAQKPNGWSHGVELPKASRRLFHHIGGGRIEIPNHGNLNGKAIRNHGIWRVFTQIFKASWVEKPRITQNNNGISDRTIFWKVAIKFNTQHIKSGS